MSEASNDVPLFFAQLLLGTALLRNKKISSLGRVKSLWQATETQPGAAPCADAPAAEFRSKGAANEGYLGQPRPWRPRSMVATSYVHEGEQWLHHGNGSTMRPTLEGLIEAVCRDLPNKFEPYALEFLRDSFPREAKLASSADIGDYDKRSDLEPTQAELVRYLQDIKVNVVLETITYQAMVKRPKARWPAWRCCSRTALTCSSTTLTTRETLR